MLLPEKLDRPVGQWALILWVAGIVIFFGAFLIGCIYAASGPGGDTERSYAPLFFPLYAGLVSAPLVVIAPLLAIYSLVNRRPSKPAVSALILGAITIVPAVSFFFGAIEFIT